MQHAPSIRASVDLVMMTRGRRTRELVAGRPARAGECDSMPCLSKTSARAQVSETRATCIVSIDDAMCLSLCTATPFHNAALRVSPNMPWHKRGSVRRLVMRRVAGARELTHRPLPMAPSIHRCITLAHEARCLAHAGLHASASRASAAPQATSRRVRRSRMLAPPCPCTRAPPVPTPPAHGAPRGCGRESRHRPCGEARRSDA